MDEAKEETIPLLDAKRAVMLAVLLGFIVGWCLGNLAR